MIKKEFKTNNDVFYSDSSFKNFFEIYNCDAKMRSILFSTLQKIECRIKSIFAYNEITQNPYNYKNIDNYDITPFNTSINNKNMHKE